MQVADYLDEKATGVPYAQLFKERITVGSLMGYVLAACPNKIADDGTSTVVQ